MSYEEPTPATTGNTYVKITVIKDSTTQHRDDQDHADEADQGQSRS